MRWGRIAFWSGFGLLALISMAVSWLFLADLGKYKSHIERWASEETGRQVSINGDLQINLARHASVVAEDIHISNADWAKQPDMVAVGRLEVRLDLGSLLNGPILIELIALDDATLFLTEREQGDPNWVLLKPSAEIADEAADGEEKGFLFRKIDLDRVQLTYSSPRRAAPIEIQLQQLRQRHRDDDLLDLSLKGTLNARDMKLEGEVGTWAALLAGKNVQFNFGASLDTFSVSADGLIDDLLNPNRPQFNFNATAPDINDLLQALGVRQQGEGAIDLVGSLTSEGQGPLELDIAGELGRLEIEASGKFSDLHDLEDMDFDLLASGEDVRPILEAFGIAQTQPLPFMINVDAGKQGKTLVIENADMVFGQAKFGLSARLPDFPAINESTIHLQIDGPRLENFRQVFNLPGAATGPFSAELRMDVADDGLELVKVDLQSSLGRLHADGKLGAAPDFYGTTLKFEAKSDSLAKAAVAYGVAGMPESPIVVSGTANYSADGIRSVDSIIVAINEATVSLDGLIKPVNGLLGSDLEFQLEGPDMAALVGAFASNTGVPVEPVEIGGQLQVRDDGFRFRDVTGTIGSSQVELDGLLVPGGRIVGSRFKVSARGAVFTEIIAQLGDFEVRPGPYELSGSILFEPERIDFDKFELSRATGKLNLDLKLGLPVERRWVNLDMRASGPNVQPLLKGVDAFEADEAPFRVEIAGQVRGKTWSVEKLDLNVGVANLTAHGMLDLDGDTSSTKFELSMDIPNVGELGTMDGNRLREDSFSLIARVTGDNNVLQIDDMLATLGKSDIKGDIEYRLGDIPYLAVDIESDAIMFAPLLVDREPENDPAPKFDDDRVIPDVSMPFEAMAKLNATVAVDIGELHRDDLHIKNLVLRAGLQDGVLEVSEAGFQAKSGAVGMRGRLDPDGGLGVASVEFVARDLALGMTELNEAAGMKGDIDINLESIGNDLRTLLGNADGILFFHSQGGRMANNRFLYALYGSMLDEIVSTINPFARTETHTSFDCIIIPIVFEQGIASSSPRTLIATDKMQMITDSEFDLKSEALEINIRTTPKKGISISAGELINPYIKVVGTLASPRLAVDETGVLLSGSAAVATGGLSILARAAWTRLSRAKDPCTEAANASIELLGDRFSTLQLVVNSAQPDTTE